MGRKNIVYDFKPIVGGDMSTAKLIGKVSTVAQHDKVTYHFNWSGADVNGVNFGVEYALSDHANAQWFPLDFGATITTDTADGMHRCIITAVGFKFLRPFSENVSGGGLLDVTVFATNEGA